MQKSTIHSQARLTEQKIEKTFHQLGIQEDRIFRPYKDAVTFSRGFKRCCILQMDEGTYSNSSGSMANQTCG